MNGETSKKPKYEASNRRFRKKRKGFQVKKEHETISSENTVDFTLSYGVNIEEDVAVTSCSGSHVVIDTDVEVADDNETRESVLPLIEESSASTSDQVCGDVSVKIRKQKRYRERQSKAKQSQVKQQLFS